MNPSLVVELSGSARSSPPLKGGGKNPAWKHAFAPYDLAGVPGATPLQVQVFDGADLVCSASVELRELLRRAAEAGAAASGGAGDAVVAVAMNGKDGKQHGDVQLQVKWSPAAPVPLQQSSQPQPQQSPPQPQLQQSPPPQQQPMLQQSPQQSPLQPGYVAASPPSGYAQPQQPIYQQPIQQSPQYAQPAYAYPQQMQMQPQPVQYGMQAPAYSQPQYAQLAPQPQQQPLLAMPTFYGQPQPMQQPMVIATAPAPMPMPMHPQQPLMHAAAAAAYPIPSPAPASSYSNADGVISFSELTFHRVLGEGSFGSVSAGEFRSTPVAIKTLKQTIFATQQQWDEFMNEVKHLREARHPNIILFMGVTMSPPCIVTELMDTSLFSVLHQERRVLSPKQQLTVALGIARGLASLHAQPVPIVHRDVKSLNVLLSFSPDRERKEILAVKICDLGMVKLKQNPAILESTGTPLWMAPEVLQDQPYDEQADVYSFGCVLFELLTGTVPFGGGNISKAELAARVGQRGERPVLPHGLSKPFKDVLVSCWQHHPRARMTMKQVVAALSAIHIE